MTSLRISERASAAHRATAVEAGIVFAAGEVDGDDCDVDVGPTGRCCRVGVGGEVEFTAMCNRAIICVDDAGLAVARATGNGQRATHFDMADAFHAVALKLRT